MRNHGKRIAASASTVLGVLAAMAAGAAATQPPVLPAETSDVATLAPAGPHRFITIGFRGSFVIFDGDSGKLEGQVPVGHFSNVALWPDNGRIYIAETLWAHGNRGKRIDLLSIYDAMTLNLLKEIDLPGRALVTPKLNDLTVSASGRRAYVYNMQPATSVIWIDLVRQTVGGSAEIPGCALTFPWGENGVSSLCSDGSLAMVTFPDQGPPQITHTKPFFDAENDPIFDNSVYDSATASAVFLSYTGRIYAAKLGADPVIQKAWSINEAAGQKAAGTGTDELAWRPGGVQPIAWHKATDRIFVLMHPGSYWSHQKGGTEIWALNLKSHALLARFPVRGQFAEKVESIVVSQQSQPQLYLINTDGGAAVVNADSGEEIRKIDEVSAVAAVVGNF